MTEIAGTARPTGFTGRSGRRPLVLAVLTALLLALTGLSPFVRSAHAATLLSQGKAATASTTENASFAASMAFDGNTTGTRWASAQGLDPSWVQVDLGSTQSISQVVLTWEAAYATAFQIQTSASAGGPWTNIYTTTTGTGGVQTLNVTGSGQFVRMNGTTRATPYGYSLWEMQVYGGGTAIAGNVISAPGAKCVDMPGNDTAGNGAIAQLWDCIATAVDQHYTAAAGQLKTLGRCLDITGNGTANGTKVELWDCNTNGGQLWAQTADGSLKNPQSGRCLDSPGGATANGTQLQIYDCNQSAAQKFSIAGGTGLADTTGTGGTCPTYPDVPNFGPNVHIYDHTMTDAAIQSSLDSIFNAQKDTATAQFANRRDAEIFKPSATPYVVGANIGFNTSILGVGLNPDDTRINGAVTVDAFNASDQGNATQNFWRSAENLSINTLGGNDRWAVAQAAPFRRIHVIGGMLTYPASFGWASGGYISDSKVDGTIDSGSQQQFYTKDSNVGAIAGSNWNMVFSGVVGAPATNFNTNPAGSPRYTNVGATPVSRDVPYLYIDAAGKYRVFLPALRTNATGTSWPNTPGTSVPMSTFYVAHEGDATGTIQTALNNGCNVFFTPGVYHLSQTLNVTKANTTVLGIGMATLIPDNGVNAMTVANVDGVRIKGILFDAGTTNSNTLLTIGTAGTAGTSHAANPTTIQDVFFRIGGAVAGKATNSLVVNSSDAIIDHIWAWRADHGAGIGWTVNTADNGLTVNGNNVLAEGLFVEHFQKDEVVWNGQGGRIIFFQNEMPYDPPNQASWMNGAQNGYAAIKVANSVTTFEAWGVGSYCFFNVNNAVHSFHAFEVPAVAGVKFHDMAIVSLGGIGTIDHIINATGGPANSTTQNVYQVAFP